MIIRACKRRGYGSKDSEKVFMRAILSDKVDPIWHLLFDDPLASSIAQTIKEIGDLATASCTQVAGRVDGRRWLDSAIRRRVQLLGPHSTVVRLNRRFWRSSR
jgi:hypothetical protein